MKKTTKVLLTLACAVLLVAASVMGTLAYLTDHDEVKNTFTVGQVHIKLDEAKVGTDGKALTGDDAERVKANSYHLLPGHVYDKDPTLTVLSGSEESYVRLLVTVTFDNKLTNEKVLNLKLDNIFTDYSSDWKRNGDPKVENKSEGDGDSKKEWTVITYEYRYKDIVEGKVAGTEEGTKVDGDNKLPALFTGITVPGTWDNAMMAAIGGFTIDVVGQAIQADGFTTADAAWAAFATQNP